MNEVLRKTRAVLTCELTTAASPPGWIVFSAEGFGLPNVRLEPETWKDMGNPEQITVVVFPGNRQDLFEELILSDEFNFDPATAAEDLLQQGLRRAQAEIIRLSDELHEAREGESMGDVFRP